MSTTTLAAASVGGGYLNTAEVRQKFFGGLSDQTIWKFIHEDGLPAHQVKRRWYFDPAEVDAWIRSRGSTNSSTAPPPAVSDADDTATVDPAWVAAQVAKFSADDLRRAGELLLALSRADR